MTAAALIVLTLFAQAGGGSPATPAQATPADATPTDLRVVVSAPVYQPDGNVAVETTTVSSEAPGVVHVFGRRTICQTATAGAAEPGDAGFGWRVTSQLVRASATSLVVSVDWQRVWDRGQKMADGPSGTVQLTLRPGDRIPLDLIPNVAPSDACRAVAMALEISVARSLAPAPPASALLPLGSVRGGAGLLDAEIWLVHTLPSGAQQAQHHRVRLPADGAPFIFAPVSVTTPEGEARVTFTGEIRRYRAATGREYLSVATARAVGRPSMSSPLTGGATTIIPLPGPDEVLALDIPTAQRGAFGGGGGGRGGRVSVGRGGAASVGTFGAGVPGSGSRIGVEQPARTGQAATGQGARGGGIVVGGGGGRGGRGGGAVASGAQILTALEGHTFSLRMRVTPVPGS